MTNPPDLPNELLTQIIRHLRDRKMGHFNSVASKDLQTMRLTCSKVHPLTSVCLAWLALSLEVIYLAVLGDRYAYAPRKRGSEFEVLAK